MFGFLKSPANKVSKQKSVDPGFLLVLTLLIQILNLIPSKLLSLRGELLQTLCVTPNFNTNPLMTMMMGEERHLLRHPHTLVLQWQETDTRMIFMAQEDYRTRVCKNWRIMLCTRLRRQQKTVNSYLKIAGDIREDATRSLVMLHQQGEQITRTHMMAADTERDLSEGEKHLNNLGGMFSKTWKPKKTREITGPIIVCRPWFCSMQCLHCGSCKYDYLFGSYHNNFTCT